LNSLIYPKLFKFSSFYLKLGSKHSKNFKKSKKSERIQIKVRVQVKKKKDLKLKKKILQAQK
jgi:hypothetical protein